MPDVLLTIREDFVVRRGKYDIVDYEKLVKDMVDKRIIKKVKCKGYIIYARHYLRNDSIKEGFLKLYNRGIAERRK